MRSGGRRKDRRRRGGSRRRRRRPPASEDQRHAVRHRREERGLAAGVASARARRARSAASQHRGGVAGVEGRVDGLGQHRRRLAPGRARPPRTAASTRMRVAVHDRPAAHGDVAAQVLDPHRGAAASEAPRGPPRAAPPRARRGPPSQAASAGRVEQARRAAPSSGARRGRALERRRRDRVGAALAGPGARLLERRGRGVVGADGRRREVPRAPVDVAVGQRVGERAVRLAALGRRGPRRRSPSARAGGGTRPARRRA